MNAKLVVVGVFLAGLCVGVALDRWAGMALDARWAGAARPSTRLLLSTAATSPPAVSLVTVAVERVVHVPVAVGEVESLAWTPPAGGVGPDRADRGGERGSWWTNGWIADRYAGFTNEWAHRAAAMRTNFIAVAQLDEEGATRFDVVVASMNIRLSDLLDPVIADLQAGLPVTPSDRARLIKEVGEVLVLTYDELSRGLPEAPVEGVVSNPLNVVQFADPRYLPFLRGFGGRRPWSGPGGAPR